MVTKVDGLKSSLTATLLGIFIATTCKPEMMKYDGNLGILAER